MQHVLGNRKSASLLESRQQTLTPLPTLKTAKRHPKTTVVETLKKWKIRDLPPFHCSKWIKDWGGKSKMYNTETLDSFVAHRAANMFRGHTEQRS